MFDGSEKLEVSATLSDAAGNTSDAAAQSDWTFDSTAPAAPLLVGSGKGFAVTEGATVSITVDGVLLTAEEIAAKFTISTAEGSTTYTVKTGVFTGAEKVSVDAEFADEAGNK